MNIPLLEQVKIAIAKEPKQFIMRWFFLNDPSQIPNCGTAACIAGHGIAIHKQMNPEKARHYAMKIDLETEAMECFDITLDQANRLFYFNSWPKQFQQKVSNDIEQAIARIDHFIKTNGEE